MHRTPSPCLEQGSAWTPRPGDSEENEPGRGCVSLGCPFLQGRTPAWPSSWLGWEKLWKVGGQPTLTCACLSACPQGACTLGWFADSPGCAVRVFFLHFLSPRRVVTRDQSCHLTYTSQPIPLSPLPPCSLHLPPPWT